MTDEQSLWEPETWTVGQWLALASGSIVLVVLTSFFAELQGDGYLHVGANWPQQLSARSAGVLPVTVRAGEGEMVEGASVELLYVPIEDDDSVGDREERIVAKLKEGKGEALAGAETDASGFAGLRLPAADSYAGESDGDSERGRRLSLVLRVDSVRGTVILEESFQTPQPVDLALTADRPLYEPGQTVLLRLAGFAPLTGEPVEEEVTWRIRDPRGNLVLQEEGALSSFGIASTRFELADRAATGEYEVEATVAGVETTRSVDVRHFRLPRFEVEVTTDEAATPGRRLEGTVEATYNWGAPVVDAEVELAMTAPAPGNIRVRERLRGTTDSAGQYRFSWRVPADVTSGSKSSKIEVRGVVSTPASRTAEGRAQVPVRADDVRLEMLPTTTGGEAKFLVVLRTGRGEPVSGATVTLHVPEADGDREIVETTDRRGVAPVDWAPGYGTETVRVRVEPEEGPSFRRTVELRSPEQRHLSVDQQAVTAGDQVSFRLDGMHDSLAVVYLVKRGMPLRAVPVPLESGMGNAEIEVPAHARGLAHLVAVGETGYRQSSVPIWVRQGAPTRVGVETDREVYRPGAEATIGLSYQGAAAFALFGVDEALYALEERTDLPLPVLLHESNDAAQAAAKGLGVLDRFEASDRESAGARMLASARFQQALGGHAAPSESRRYANDLTDETGASGSTIWTLFSLGLALLTLLILAFAGRIPLGHLRGEDLSLRALLTVVIGSFVVVLVGLLLAAAGGAAVFGGSVVWGVTLVGFFIDAIRRYGDLHLGRWLALVAVAALVALASSIGGYGHGLVGPRILTVLRLEALVGLFLVALQAGIWLLILTRREHWSGSVGMLTFGWIAVACSLVVLFADCQQMQMERGVGGSRQMAADESGAGQEVDRFVEVKKAASQSGSQAGESGGPRVRSYFPETMVWEPEVLSDKEGEAELNVALPDSITTWRLTAMAQTPDGQFAESDHPLVVRKPFFLNVELPPDLTEGDLVDVPVTVSNESSRRVQATLQVEASGGLSPSRWTRESGSMTLEADSRRVVEVPVRATGTGSGALTVSATIGSGEIEGDAERRSVRILPDGRRKTVSRSTIIGEEWSDKLPLPAEVVPGTLEVETAISGGAIADAFEGLDAMLRQPNGCFEQVSSVNYPNAMILRRLRATEPEAWPGGEDEWEEAHEKAERMLSLGYQRMLAFQTDGGGFRLYPDDDYEPDPMLTAYGLMQLTDMREVLGVDVEAVVRNTVQWLQARQNDSGTWPVYASRTVGGGHRGEDVGQVRSTAFVVWALLQVPEGWRKSAPVEEALDHVEQAAPDVSDPNALAYAANALIAGNRDEAARVVLDRLASVVEREEGAAHWSAGGHTWVGGYGRYADVETTALVANAMAETESHGELMAAALRYLAEQRAPKGGWGTTQATVWSLRAFEKLRSAPSDKPVDLKVYGGGRPMPRATGEGEKGKLRLGPGDERMVRFEATPDETGGVSVRVDASRKTDAIARSTAFFAVPWDSAVAKAERAAFDLEVTVGERRVTRREPVEATLTLRNRTETRHGATIVELPLPPGGWVDRRQFDDLRQGGVIDHYEVLPTHVRLYLSEVAPRERLDFAWTFTTAVSGQYALPPARAYPFYVPQPKSEVDGGDLAVMSE